MKKKRVKAVNKLFSTALNNKIFSCGAVGFSKWKNSSYERFVEHYGFIQYEPFTVRLTKDHFFDLASLTKPLSTVLVLLSLFEKKIIQPDTQLGDIYPWCPADKKKITLQQLMSHGAGFVPHREYFNELIHIPQKQRKDFLLKSIFEEKLESKREGTHCYSDLGFILLGLIIEKIMEQDLGEIARVVIYEPLGLQNDLLFPGLHPKKDKTYVCTEKRLKEGTMLSGVVHDDNCRAMGGEAGHAGLFGSLFGVMTLCEHLLDQWQNRAQHLAYSNVLLQKILTRIGESSWTMGFDMVSEEGSSSGKYFSKESVGHLGFTGTSFWMDPKKDCIVVLLTNRVYYGWENWKIKKFRPELHNLLMAEESGKVEI